MIQNNIKEILNELYLLDPSLRRQEKDLVKLINKLLEVRFETKFNKEFAEELKRQVLLKFGENQKKDMKNKFKIFSVSSSLSLRLAFSALVLVLAVFAFSGLLSSKDAGRFKEMKLSVNKLSAGAFGTIISTGQTSVSSPELLEKNQTRVIGLGGGGQDMAVKEIGIMPPFMNVKYVYRGEEINLDGNKREVYRRLNRSEEILKNAGDLTRNLKISAINFGKMKNLKMESINLKEDRDFGYSFGLGSDTGYFYMGKNWEKWPDPYASCRNDESCYDRMRLQESDILSDEELLKIADNFLAEYGINLENYGSAEIDKSWKNYTQPEGQRAYIPEEILIIRPLKINGKEVYGEGGQKIGINLSIDLRNKKVSSFSTNLSLEYESSEYEIVTDSERIIALAEKANRIYYGSENDENAKIISLGDPFEAVVLTWRYNEESGNGEEIYVPALVFPVIEKPEEFYYINNVVVPLIKDIVEEKEKNSDNINFIEPVLFESEKEL